MCGCGGRRRSGLAPNNPELINKSLIQSYKQPNRNPIVSHQQQTVVTHPIISRLVTQPQVVTKPQVVNKPVISQLLQANRPIFSGNLPSMRRK